MKTGGVSDFFQDIKMNQTTVHYDNPDRSNAASKNTRAQSSHMRWD